MPPWAVARIDPLAWCGWLPGYRLRLHAVRPPGPIGRPAPNMEGGAEAEGARWPP